MSSWELFSSHGLVLIYFSRHPRARLRDAAEAIGLTERAVQNNIRDLAASGHLLIEKVGRRNRYRVVGRKHLTHPTTRSVSLSQLLQLFKLSERQDSSLVTTVVKKTKSLQSPTRAVEDTPQIVAEPASNTAKEIPIQAKAEPKSESKSEPKHAVETALNSDTEQKPEVTSSSPVKTEKLTKSKKSKAEKDDSLPQQDLLF
ncbi:MAG: hypothetical protein L3J24_02490 [Xanthomonadales bacterium]|nr:hypothetical protein [Xanthomonadales bacterium]